MSSLANDDGVPNIIKAVECTTESLYRFLAKLAQIQFTKLQDPSGCECSGIPACTSSPGRSVSGFLVAFTVRLWKFTWFLKLPMLAAVSAIALRFLQGRNPIRMFASWVRISGWFREPGSPGIYNTQGMHFFVTDTGFTGSTSGMLAMDHGDYLVQVRGCTMGGGYLIVRPRNDDKTMSYRVVGAAYVGKGPLAVIQTSQEAA
ncbi:hypothetical protein QBC36DRAFT_316562 [Triangularia setosa]|uniref:Uncharacterized protein n=1 Tax=Triangularia setosa TaxID=2587417 RepID=A0AAN6VVQ1_9PEZI|nr:hypothetical protein QBC36DRAFT_316562 [Podospora setosa]